MPGTVAPGMKRMRRGCAGSPAPSAGRTASIQTPSGILNSRGEPGSLEYKVSRPSWGETTTSTGCWWRSARFTAALRKVATPSTADTMRTLSSPDEGAGKLTPTISAMMATTTIISTRVTPRRVRWGGPPGPRPTPPSAGSPPPRWGPPRPGRRDGGARADRGSGGPRADRGVPPPGGAALFGFPTDNVGIGPFAAGLAIGAEADDLRFVGLMFAGEAVDEIMGPGILGDVPGHVRAVPLVDIGGLHAQRLQALLGSGEGARIEFVHAQRGPETIDLGAGGGDFGFIRLLEQHGSDESHE